MRRFRITINGTAYDVDVELSGGEHEAAAPVSETKSTAAPKAASGSGFASPLAGKIVTIHAKTGDRVKAGEPLVTLEAMKMNTVAAAPADGTVGAIHVNPGDEVSEGQELLAFS